MKLLTVAGGTPGKESGLFHGQSFCGCKCCGKGIMVVRSGKFLAAHNKSTNANETPISIIFTRTFPFNPGSSANSPVAEFLKRTRQN